MRVVTIRQILLRHINGTARAFGDILASHFNMNAAAMRAFSPVDGKEATHFGQNPFKRTRFIAILRLDDIAVHRITRPDNRVALGLHCAHQRRQMRLNLIMAIAGDQRHPPCHAIGVERIEQTQQRVWLKAWPALHANGVADAAQIFNVRRADKTRPVADPQHMGRCVIPLASE